MKRISSWDWPNAEAREASTRFEDALRYYYWESFQTRTSWPLEVLANRLDDGLPRGILQEELLGSLGMSHVYS